MARTKLPMHTTFRRNITPTPIEEMRAKMTYAPEDVVRVVEMLGMSRLVACIEGSYLAAMSNADGITPEGTTVTTFEDMLADGAVEVELSRITGEAREALIDLLASRHTCKVCGDFCNLYTSIAGRDAPELMDDTTPGTLMHAHCAPVEHKHADKIWMLDHLRVEGDAPEDTHHIGIHRTRVAEDGSIEVDCYNYAGDFTQVFAPDEIVATLDKENL